MSGPKTSRYTLTSEQRRILEEQRKIERRKAVATGNIKRNQKRLLQIGEMFGVEKRIADELNARVGFDNGISNLLKKLDTLITPINPLVLCTNFDDVNSVEETSEVISTCLKEAEKIVEKITNVSSLNENNLKKDLQKAIDGGIATSFENIYEIKVSEIASLRHETMQRLEKMQTISFLSQTYKSKIRNTINKLKEITDDVFLKNYVAVVVNPLIKQVNQFLSEYKDCQAEFEILYAEYAALCELYYYTAQEYPCCNSSIEILKSEIKRIKDEADVDDENAYISDCLDEVMVEMGYTVLGSRKVTKRNGKKFRNELYSYGEGTAVNITYSSDGKIAMELGGTDTSDRVPTAQETDKLCDLMQQFCDDFKEIEKRLLSKGVVLAHRISLLPASSEYAQIINTSDYFMKDKAETVNVKKQRRTTNKQKAFRRE